QTCQAQLIVTVHPVTQRLAVHPSTARRLRSVLALQHQSQGQRSPCLRTVGAARRRLAQVMSRKIGPRDRNRHVQTSLSERVLNRTIPRRRKSQASQHIGRLVLYQRPYVMTTFAHSLEAMAVILSGTAM